jgi:hypothetical protein
MRVGRRMKIEPTLWRVSLFAAITALLAGCGATTNSGYSTSYDAYGRPTYATGVNSYGQPVDQYGRPVPVNAQMTGAYNQPVYGQPAYAGDDYVYYPDSEVYYSPAHRDYVYWERDRWAHHSAPPRAWNQSSLSVHVNFGNDPWNHHNEVIRRYPRNQRNRDRDRDWDRDRR